jgi:ABC-type uncharacterized transport system permease subunit
MAIVTKISEVNLFLLEPLSFAILVPIAWTAMFFLGALTAKLLVHLEAVRRIAVGIFDFEKYPLQATAICVLIIFAIAFWIPVGAYAAFNAHDVKILAD